MIFNTIAQVLAVGSSLMVTPVALPGVCNVNVAPVINVRPITKAIEYDKTKSSAELTAMSSNTISPYGLNVDQATGGLRHDQPITKIDVKYHYLENPQTGTFCMAYNEINVDIILQPKIYIATEYALGRCGVEVMNHEKKHVHVDRLVINKYSREMGLSIQKAVNALNVVGPFPVSRAKEMQQTMFDHIHSALKSTELLMVNEMNQRQQAVDSLEEYERVGSHCEFAKERVFGKRKE